MLHRYISATFRLGMRPLQKNCTALPQGVQDKLLPSAWNPEEQHTKHGVYDRTGECRSFTKNSYFLSVDYTKYESMQRNTQPLVNTFDQEETQLSMFSAPLLTLSTLLMSFKRRDDQ